MLTARFNSGTKFASTSPALTGSLARLTTNQPLHIWLVFVLLFNFISGMVPPGSVMPPGMGQVIVRLAKITSPRSFNLIKILLTTMY